MFFVVNHRIWADIQFPTELYAVHILLNRSIEVGEDIYHHMTFTSVESSLGYEVSEFWFNQIFILPSVESKMYTLQFDVFEDLKIPVVDQPNVKPLVEVDSRLAICQLLKQLHMIRTG